MNAQDGHRALFGLPDRASSRSLCAPWQQRNNRPAVAPGFACPNRPSSVLRFMPSPGINEKVIAEAKEIMGKALGAQ
jgi:hypothetical protein